MFLTQNEPERLAVIDHDARHGDRYERPRITYIGAAARRDQALVRRCVMEVKLKDGRTLTQQTMAAKGSFENPLTRDEEEEKALDLIVPVLGKQRALALLAALWNFDELKDVRALRKLYST